jgi:hypothetical protein
MPTPLEGAMRSNGSDHRRSAAQRRAKKGPAARESAGPNHNGLRV